MLPKNPAMTLGAPAACAGQALRITDVFHEYAPFAWRVLRRLGVSEADANDVCQEVFITVHRRLSEFEARSSIRTWVFEICVRFAADYRKRMRRRREVAPGGLPEVTIDAGQERELSVREASGILDRILDGIDDEKREVFVLYEIEELSMTEVAESVGCPLQTAYSRLHAARREIEAAVQRLCAKGNAP